ncbi:MAG: type IV secretion system protein, partial [Acidocella sp.]|nr:type IV secretion system protein [Acidocella sp.]
DAIWNEANELFVTAERHLNFYNVLYSVELGLLQDFIVFPIGITFLIYEATRIMIDVMVSIGPFVLAGYLFTATRGIADRFIGKLIGLTILTLLIDIVLSIIINGDAAYFNVSMTNSNHLHSVFGFPDAGQPDLRLFASHRELSWRWCRHQSVEYGIVRDAGGACGAICSRWHPTSSRESLDA